VLCEVSYAVRLAGKNGKMAPYNIVFMLWLVLCLLNVSVYLYGLGYALPVPASKLLGFTHPLCTVHL
jgi:hypothetical protein